MGINRPQCQRSRTTLQPLWLRLHPGFRIRLVPIAMAIAFLSACLRIQVTQHNATSGTNKTFGPRKFVPVTQHNDIERTGATYDETKLTRFNVAGLTRLASLGVDGQIYAQPLYVPKVRITASPFQGTHNTVFVATANNTVYAFDADSFQLLWQRSVGQAPSVAEISARLGGCGFWVVYPTMGLISTPVIDVASATLFAVAKVNTGNAIEDHIVALATADGSPMHTPVKIEGQAGSVIFDPLHELNRAGLLLVNGRIFVAYAGLCEKDPYQGWVFGFNSSDLTITGPPYCSSCSEADPNMAKAGIWQAGNGLASDGSSIYFMTGNGGAIGGSVSPDNRGDSFIRLDLNLQETAHYTPTDGSTNDHKAQWLASCDLDLGSAGPVVVPEAGLLFGGGKEGILYFLDLALGYKEEMVATDVPNSPWPDIKTRLMHICASDPNDQNSIHISNCQNQWQCLGDLWHAVQDSGDVYSHIHGSPVILKVAANEFRIYVWGEEDFVRRFDYINGAVHDPHIHSTEQALQDNMPGGILSLSADRSNLYDSALLWGTKPLETAIDPSAYPPTSHGALNATVKGGLYAFDGATLKTLWSSETLSGNALGLVAKMSPPTVANGRVYVANFGREPSCRGRYRAGNDRSGPQGCGQLVVYGLQGGAPHNPCGGSNDLLALPNTFCYDKATRHCGRWRCAGAEAVICDTSLGMRNECDGCGPPSVPGTSGAPGSPCFYREQIDGIFVCYKGGLICCPLGMTGPTGCQ